MRFTGPITLAFATTIWLPTLSAWFGVDPDTWSRQLAARHLELWADSEARTAELDRMRRSNAEWDFMGRTYLTLALADLALREPERATELVGVIDAILEQTLTLERERGQRYFLMDYASHRSFVSPSGRSQFVDGEIALMLAVRRVVRDDRREWQRELEARVQIMVARMNESPVLSAESYPDECWTFCNTMALAAIRLRDHLDGDEHRELLERWVKTARARLVDPHTGLLISAYTLDGEPLQGPEGSSIWMISHTLRIIDPELAAEQYALARQHLGRDLLGFGYAVEWPATWRGESDIDSGPIVPLLGASAGSSGLALVAAASFDDRERLTALTRSLELAAFPSRTDGVLRYRASNQVGDAVLLYASLLGPTWDRVLSGGGDS